MEEIFKNGPVVVNFEPRFDFLYYRGGIYHSNEAADWILEGKKKPEWVEIDILYNYRKKWTTLFCVMVGAKMMVRSSGCFKIVGAAVGEKMGDLGRASVLINL
jgi:hypothetical protein